MSANDNDHEGRLSPELKKLCEDLVKRQDEEPGPGAFETMRILQNAGITAEQLDKMSLEQFKVALAAAEKKQTH